MIPNWAILLPVLSLISFIFFLMDITIGVLVLIMQQGGLEGSYVLNWGIGRWARCSLIVLLVYIKKMGTNR